MKDDRNQTFTEDTNIFTCKSLKFVFNIEFVIFGLIDLLHKQWTWMLWGVITAKIKFGILLCCFPMRFLIFSLVFLMFSMMFAKTSLLFCYFCIRLFQPRCYYSCPYAVMRNLDAIIRVRMLLCETSMLLFVSVCWLCETSMLLFVFRIMFVLIRVFRELDRYGLARGIN